MNFLAFTWIPIGLVIGALAGFCAPNRTARSFMATLMLGLGGGFLGAILSWVVFMEPNAPFRPMTAIIETTGALIAVFCGVTLRHFRRAK